MISIHALRRPPIRPALTLTLLAVLAGAGALPASATATARHSAATAAPGCPPSLITVKLWVVSNKRALNAQFPAPKIRWDAKFCTNGITYIGNNNPNPPHPRNHCWTIDEFLNGCTSRVAGTGRIFFSGKHNPNLGNKAANLSTPIGEPDSSVPGYGTLMDFTGTVDLAHGQQIMICHDDGASLRIDGANVPGFTGTGEFPPLCESATWRGTAGTHRFDLLYANWTFQNDGIWIQFFPRFDET